MPSTRRSRGSGPRLRRGFALLPFVLAATLSLLVTAAVGFGPLSAGAAHAHGEHGDGGHGGGDYGGGSDHGDDDHGYGGGHGPPPPHDPPPYKPPHDPPPCKPPADNPPPEETPPPEQGPTVIGTGSSSIGPPAAGLGGVAGASTSGHADDDSDGGGPSASVIVPPHTNPSTKIAHHKAKPAKSAARPPAAGPPPTAAASSGNPHRSNFADRLLSPTQIDLSAENLGKGGLFALLLAALLYLPVTIFNKATEKNPEAFKRLMQKPHALMLFLFGWIPFRGRPLFTLTFGVVASAVLFSFIEPGFPTEEGAPQYLIGMLLGFALVSIVFFSTWRFVIHRLEPGSEGEWKLYPPFIFLAAFLVVMARLAHFIPGVVLGTVAEYEPAKRLSVRTAGIRVAVTYGVLMAVGLAAWFAWIPVEHAASKEGASNLTLILDSALAITFVSSLESVAFGLLPMRFLDGNDLFTWHKGLWAAMWGGALVWFSIVILHPALSTYSEESGHHVFWFVLLFSSLMVAALTTWGYFRVRDARAQHSGSSA